MELKQRIAGTIKWNLVDKLISQALYAVTGIVLARQLSQADFGLVGAALVVQAFALMFVDSGFASALLQRKAPTQRDYSTVFWFNIAISVVIYVILWFGAPLIALWFHSDELITLSRVMFLSVPLNALGIVQTNRLIKQMNVKPVTVANAAALSLGSVVGIVMALTVANAWALVAQTLVNTAGRSAILWLWVRWRPSLYFSWAVLGSFFKVGAGVMGQAFMNNIFQNVFGFFIGNRVSMSLLGLYSQADKWSKMAYESVRTSLTSSFLPAIAEVQDQPERLGRVTSKMNAVSGLITFPVMGWLFVAAAPLFHLLFGTKWDDSIILFKVLALRGIFIVLTAIYSNYILGMGRSRLLVLTEFVRDVAALAALAYSLPDLNYSVPGYPQMGVAYMLMLQFAVSFLMWILTMVVASRTVSQPLWRFAIDTLRYLPPALVGLCAAYWIVGLEMNDFMRLFLSALAIVVAYLITNPRDIISFIASRFDGFRPVAPRPPHSK